jgi:CRP-like cAMP-binding protein
MRRHSIGGLVGLGLPSGPVREVAHAYEDSSPTPTPKSSNWATVRDAFCNSPSSMIATLNGKSSQLLRTPDNIPAERSSSETGKSGKQRLFWRYAKVSLTAATVISAGTVPMCIAFGAPASTTWQFVFGKSFLLGPFDGFIWFLLALTELIRRTSFTKDHEEMEASQDQASVRFSKVTRFLHSIVDATSMLPLDIVAMAAGIHSMRTIGLCRLTRLVRIAREFHTATKRGHTTAACVTVGLVVIHILSCIYWLMAYPGDGAGLRGFGSKELVMEGWSQQNWSLPYIFALYFVVSALGGVSIVVEPETIDETLFTLVLMFLSIGISAGISALVCMLMQNALIEKQSSQISKNTVSDWMRAHKFPFTSRVAIFQRLEMAPVGDSQNAFDHAMHVLPRALLMDHCFIQYETLLRECPLFANMESCVIRELCIELRPKTFSAGDFVYRYGNRAVEGIVFIRKGIAKCFAQNSKQNKILSRGQYHQTSSLFTNAPRSDSLKALSSLDVVTLSKSRFDSVMEAYAIVDPDGIQRALEDFQSMLIAEAIDDRSSTCSSPVGPEGAGSEEFKRKGSSGSVSSDRMRKSDESDRSAKNTSDMNKNALGVSETAFVDSLAGTSVIRRKLNLDSDEGGPDAPALAVEVRLGADDQHG